jgi:FG-GAP-like repeat
MRKSTSFMLAWVSVLVLASGALPQPAPTATPIPTDTPTAKPGEIRFQGRQPNVVPGNVSSMAVDDLNLDGFSDLAVSSSPAGRVTVMLGDGSGDFSSLISTDPFRTRLIGIATGDFDGDGIPDVATTDNQSDTFAVLLGRGDGLLGVPTFFRTGMSPVGIVAGDFDGQPGLDVAVANGGEGTISVFFNKDTGRAAFTNPSNFPSRIPFYLFTGDFNDDGNLDIVALNPGGGSAGNGDVTLLVGNGVGGFQSRGGFLAGDAAQQATVGDFNNDGIPDVAVTNARASSTTVTTSAITILLSDGAGNFNRPAQIQVNCASLASTICKPGPIAAADLDGDGNTDLAVGIGISNVVLIYAGNGDGTFDPVGSPITLQAPPGVLLATDIDSDGRTDLIVGGGALVQVLLNVTEPIVPIVTRTPNATMTPTPTPMGGELTPVVTGSVTAVPPTTKTPGSGKQRGDICSDNSECATPGICAQNRCCDRACNGTTERCDLNPPGICQSIPPSPTAVPAEGNQVFRSGGCSVSPTGGSPFGPLAVLLLPGAVWLNRRMTWVRLGRSLRRPR